MRDGLQSSILGRCIRNRARHVDGTALSERTRGRTEGSASAPCASDVSSLDRLGRADPRSDGLSKVSFAQRLHHSDRSNRPIALVHSHLLCGSLGHPTSSRWTAVSSRYLVHHFGAHQLLRVSSGRVNGNDLDGLDSRDHSGATARPFFRE